MITSTQFIQTLAIAIVLCASQFTIGVPPAFGVQPFDDESSQIESYLRSLRLNRLVIEHVENAAANETDEKQRLDLARRLVTLYSKQLMTGQSTDANYRQKANWLLRAYPQLSTPAIRMALSQAKYTEVERAYLAWWYDGAPANNKTSLVDDLRELNSELATLSRKLEEEYQDRIALIQTSPESRASESRQIVQTENLVLHGHYLSGWTSYFRGVLSTSERTNHFRKGNEHFRKFLQIEPQKVLNDVSPKWFDFTSDWSIRALVGLSMCEQGVGHEEQAKYCLDLIEEHSTNQKTRDMRYVWELNSHLYIGEFAELDSFIETGQSSTMSESGGVRFWNELLKASVAIKTKSLTKSKLLMANGLAGLARNFQADLISDFLGKHKITLETNDSWELWVAGYLEFVQAETTNNQQAFESAKEKLVQAIRVAGPETYVNDIHCCRFFVARIDLIQKRYELAANAFQEVSDAMLSSNRDIASEAQWLAIVALSKLGEKEPRNAFKAIRLIDQATIRFPGSTVAKRAKFERLRLGNLRLPIEKAIEALNRIEPSDINYPLAVNEIVKQRYRLALETLESKERAPSSLKIRFDDLLEADTKYRELSGVSDSSKLKSSLLVVDALLRIRDTASEIQTNQLVTKQLEVADALATRVLQSPEYVEYRFYQFQFAIRTGDIGRIESEGTWQTENAKGSPYEKSALIQLAQIADQSVNSQTQPSQQSISKAISCYERLLEVIGTSDESLLTLANARVGYSRLAELKMLAGNHQQAIQMSENLVRLFPKHVAFMRQLAKARTELKDYESAIPIWRKLAKGVGPGSESWFEAKYYLCFCHFHNDSKVQAEQLIQQTIRLGGEMPDVWQSKFETLKSLVSTSLEESNSEQQPPEEKK